MKDLIQSHAEFAHAEGLIDEPTIDHLRSHLDQFSPEKQEEFFDEYEKAVEAETH